MASVLSFLYIGPGAGIGAVGAMVALLGAALLMVFGLVWYPLRRLVDWSRRARHGRRPRRAEPRSAAGAAPADAESGPPTSPSG